MRALTDRRWQLAAPPAKIPGMSDRLDVGVTLEVLHARKDAARRLVECAAAGVLDHGEADVILNEFADAVQQSTVAGVDRAVRQVLEPPRTLEVRGTDGRPRAWDRTAQRWVEV
jgi:predicted nucleic acid-binding protein